MTTQTADCGHTYDAPQTSGASGYAWHRDPDTKREARICYTCANVLECVEMLAANAYTGYLSNDTKRITTWTGGTLAIVTEAHATKIRTDIGGTMVNGRALDTSGARWAFRSQGQGCITHLRRIKTAK